ncbi:hypothetical protein Tco_0605322, partial [Tanacetum coccineum]
DQIKLKESALEFSEASFLAKEKDLQHKIEEDCKMVVKEIVSRLLEEEEKLEWWFEQDIDKEEERFEGDEDGGEV